MSKKLIGVDIGGTKCAVCLGEADGQGVQVLQKCTPRATAEYTPDAMIEGLIADILELTATLSEPAAGIGISCGGPLSSRRGLILSPPNLPGWDEIAIVEKLQQATGLPAWLCNDANACALAEWKMGAGQGADSMIFMTFGTGLGGGLILNGRLYEGACDMAGELGHIRLAEDGPIGYGKRGSFEGFCSGGGIARLGQEYARSALRRGLAPAFCKTADELSRITAASVGAAAAVGDATALSVLRHSGERLGQGLAMLIDLLNPEKIVIGSIFARCHPYLWPAAKSVLEKECLPEALAACEVLPAALGDSVGDIAALMIAQYHTESEGTAQ
ncbi:ROK family protein [Pygmaiobacter massiliensis]|uniref:ROK family protein n=1 Tax=Pygmaiobacter massiliensis TaxID=1917873 RepID=UPI002A82AD3E|nr:ROK family protein [Pygmaiobacter massiliensis]MDY4785252.1 ROK family protein [Pygmaiobacter massiliensis]